MPGAVIYCRVSTKEQTENLSLPTQQRECEEYCRREGFTILRVFIDGGESAKTTERPELQQLLAYCRQNKGRVQCVVVFNVTRFARQKYDHVTLRVLLQKLGVTLRSVTEPIDDTSTGTVDGGHPRVLRTVRQRPEGRAHEDGHDGCATTWEVDVQGSPRLPQQLQRNRVVQPDSRSSPGTLDSPGLRGIWHGQ